MKYCPRCHNKVYTVIPLPSEEEARFFNQEEGGDDSLVGEVIAGRYLVLSLLGRGSMGAVYLVEHLDLGKKMAIKLLRWGLRASGPIAERFKREARAACRIGNPHIIEISDFGSLSDGRLYFVMEQLKGESLEDLVRREAPLRVDQVAQIALQACEGLGAAHEAGIIHRDIKPANIFLQRVQGRDVVKILDFGIAKTLPGDEEEKGILFGTPHYISPEQAQGWAVDIRTDIYSLGVTLYRMVTGRLPFAEDSSLQTLFKHIHEAPEPPEEVAPDSPAAALFSSVILRAMAKDPARRYGTCREMVGDIRRIVSLMPLVEGQEMDWMDAVVSQWRRRISRRNKILFALGGVLLTLVLSVPLAILLRGEEEKVRGDRVIYTQVAKGEEGPAKVVKPEPRAHRVRLESHPLGAEVVHQGRVLGRTPMEAMFLGREVKLSFRRRGYREVSTMVTPEGAPLVSVRLARRGARGRGAKRVGTPLM